jgi:hypothetical protein
VLTTPAPETRASAPKPLGVLAGQLDEDGCRGIGFESAEGGRRSFQQLRLEPRIATHRLGGEDTDHKPCDCRLNTDAAAEPTAAEWWSDPRSRC